MTPPLAAHGRRHRAPEQVRDCGILASIWLSVSRVRATRPSSRTKAAMPSMAGANSGTTNPPRPSAAKITSSGPRPRVSASRRGRRPLAPGRRGTGRPARPPGWWSPAGPPGPRSRSAATRSSKTSSARSSLISSPVLVHERDPLAHRVEPDAERGPGRGHQRRQPLQPGALLRRWSRSGEPSSSRLLTVSTSTPSRPSRLGSTSDAVPPAQSTTTFSAGLADAGHVDAAQQLAGCRTPPTRGGKVSSAISPGNARRNSCREKTRSSLRCAAWDRSAPLLVQEDDVDALRVARRGAQHDAAGCSRLAGGLEPGHRQRRRLQVPDVDRAGVERADAPRA